MAEETRKVKTKKLSWDDTFMGLALLVSERTSCKFHKVGVVLVDERKRIVSLGYNGPTEGDDHCIEIGCAKIAGDSDGKYKRCRGIHAEINAIINCQDTRRLRGSTLYTTSSPCYDCVKALNNVGISEIVFYENYTRLKTGGEGKEEENEAWELAEKRGIKVRQHIPKEVSIKIT